MVTLADSLVSSSSRTLSLRMRSDLTSRRQMYHGRSYWVVKEPLGLRYYRFQEEEYAILKMLDGRSSLDEIKKRFEKEFSPQKITLQELQDFIGMLHRSGLVISNEIGQGPQLRKRGSERKRKEMLSMLANILAVRYKGIDPEWILSKIYPYVAWFFSVPAFICCIILGLSALTLISVQFDVFRARLPAFQEFFGPQNWLLLAVVLGCTKILHEFGHGLSCKHFGGECHELGVMLLVLTPCLYCNVSDSWMLPNKWHRAAIGAAGMYVELMLASVATFVWWFTEPGIVNYLCLRVMFISSVSTVLFNANPLLRFDGYYILADLVEIPNLRQKSSTVLNNFLCKWCLGMDVPEDPFLPKRNQWFFVIYTIAAVLYRWFIVIAILIMLNQVFKPYGLQILGQMVAVASIAGMLIQPVWKLWKFFTVPGRMNQIKMYRLYITVGVVVVAIVVGGWLIPVPYYVSCPAEVRPLGEESVYVDVPGRLVEVNVRPGQQVEAGQVLAKLENLDLKTEIEKLQGDYDKNEKRLKNLQFRRFDDRQALTEVAAAEKTLAMIQEQLKERSTDHARLTLTAPASGMVLPPPSKPEEKIAPGKPLPTWGGTPMDSENLGATLPTSTLFCMVGDPRRLKVVLVISEDDIERVQLENEVSIKFEAYPGRVWKGKIAAKSSEEMKVSPPSLSTQAGGQLATQTDETGAQKPQNTSYEAYVPLDRQQDDLLRLRMRGEAKVFTGYTSLAYRIWRAAIHLFHFELD